MGKICQTPTRSMDGGITCTLFYYSTAYSLAKEPQVRLAESITIESVAR